MAGVQVRNLASDYSGVNFALLLLLFGCQQQIAVSEMLQSEEYAAALPADAADSVPIQVNGLAEKTITCHCDGVCANNETTCQTRPGGKCYSLVLEYVNEDTNIVEQDRMYGCMSPDEDGGMFQCPVGGPSVHGENIACCDNENYCNRNVHPIFKPDPTTAPAFTTPSTTLLPLADGASSSAAADSLPLFALLTSVIVCSGVFLILLTALYLIYRRRERRHSGAKHAAASPHACLIDTMMRGCGGSGSGGGSSAHNTSHLADLVELTSGSGSGLPLLVQRTIVKEIEFTQLIGQGRYGKVFLAKFRGENVAAKVFNPAAEASWFREAEIYQSVMMRHENIMSFIAADIDGSGQRMLITHYHEQGSLQDYLQANVLSTTRLLELAHSLAAGLAHLHTEIYGSPGKPAIAHGDINSKNVLVKKDGRCAIADFGLAIKYASDLDDIQLPKNPRGPSVRYMAPELLDRSLVADKFESYKAVDIYACGLVLWEMARGCATPVKGSSKKTVCDEYALPYADVVPPTLGGGAEPRADEMRRVVCGPAAVRPLMPARWDEEEVLRQLRAVIVDCWWENPQVRLTALRVKKTLSKMLAQTQPGGGEMVGGCGLMLGGGGGGGMVAMPMMPSVTQSGSSSSSSDQFVKQPLDHQSIRMV